MFKTSYETDIKQIKNTPEKGSGVASKDDLDNTENKMPNVLKKFYYMKADLTKKKVHYMT